MERFKYIIVFLALTSIPCFSQSFSNLDSLLIKNYEAVNKRDTVYYLSLINKTSIYKNAKTKADSLAIINPFKEAFRDIIDEFTELSMSPDYTVAYAGYEIRNKSKSVETEGRLALHVNLIINDSFSIKMPVFIDCHSGLYSIQSPMLVMVVDSKE